MPRTATTFLQQQVFPEFSGVKFYGLPFTQINPAFNAAMFADETEFNQKELLSTVSSLGENKVLISNENFVGQSMYWHFGNRTRIAQRLQIAMPEATILLFIRNQPDLIRSLYLIALQDTETKTLTEYLRKPRPSYNLETYRLNPKAELFDYAPFDTYHTSEQVNGFDYSTLISLYKSLFERVEVFLFEDFAANPHQTYQRLASILGIEISNNQIQKWVTLPKMNSGTGQNQTNWLRRLNRWHNVLCSNRIGSAFYVRAKRAVINQLPKGNPVQWNEEDNQFLRKHFGPRNLALHQQFPELGIDNYAREYMLEKVEI